MIQVNIKCKSKTQASTGGTERVVVGQTISIPTLALLHCPGYFVAAKHENTKTQLHPRAPQDAEIGSGADLSNILAKFHEVLSEFCLCRCGAQPLPEVGSKM
jgi:hypothetical protein